MRSRSSSPTSTHQGGLDAQRKRSRSPGAESATSEPKRAHSLPDDQDSDQDSLGTSRLQIMDPSLQSEVDDFALSPSPLGHAPESPSSTAAESDSSAEADSPPAYSQQPFTLRSPDGPNQVELITEMRDQSLVAGESWYLVERAWFRRWSSIASGVRDEKNDVDDDLTLEDIGPVDNAPLATADGELRREPRVQLGVDVEVVPEAAWRYLVEWCVPFLFL